MSSHGIARLRYRQSINGIPDFETACASTSTAGPHPQRHRRPAQRPARSPRRAEADAGAAMAAFQRNVGVNRVMQVKSRGTGARQIDDVRRRRLRAPGDLRRHGRPETGLAPDLPGEVDRVLRRRRRREHGRRAVPAEPDQVRRRDHGHRPGLPGGGSDPKAVGGFDKSTQNATIAPNLVTEGWLSAGSDDLSGRLRAHVLRHQRRQREERRRGDPAVEREQRLRLPDDRLPGAGLERHRHRRRRGRPGGRLRQRVRLLGHRGSEPR